MEFLLKFCRKSKVKPRPIIYYFFYRAAILSYNQRLKCNPLEEKRWLRPSFNHPKVVKIVCPTSTTIQDNPKNGRLFSKGEFHVTCWEHFWVVLHPKIKSILKINKHKYIWKKDCSSLNDKNSVYKKYMHFNLGKEANLTRG